MIFLGRELSERRNYSEKFAQIIDKEISGFIKLCYNKTQNVLQKIRQN